MRGVVEMLEASREPSNGEVVLRRFEMCGEPSWRGAVATSRWCIVLPRFSSVELNACDSPWSLPTRRADVSSLYHSACSDRCGARPTMSHDCLPRKQPHSRKRACNGGARPGSECSSTGDRRVSAGRRSAGRASAIRSTIREMSRSRPRCTTTFTGSSTLELDAPADQEFAGGQPLAVAAPDNATRQWP